jgi:uncharacterized membrane protein YraQ (UPF0718 family)
MKVLEKIKKNKLLVLVALIYIGLFIFAPEKAKAALDNSVYYLLEMLQVLPVIFLLTVLIDAWIPKETITKRLGNNSGFVGNIFSLILGSLSAGPIYAAFPLSKMLLKKGASITNIVIILSSWAVIKVPMLLNEAKFLGIKFMAARWVFTVIAILLMGYLVSVIVKKKDLPESKKTFDSHKKLEVNEDYCVGCGLCAKMAPETFEIKDRKAYVKSEKNKDIAHSAIESIKEKCPGNAII